MPTSISNREWDKAFAEVNAERAQYKAAVTQSNRIELLAADFESRLVLRGKIIDWRPRIEEWATSVAELLQRHRRKAQPRSDTPT